ncbi:phenylalanine--tRNA ligase subunit beta [soil metagenome]
MIVSWNWLSEYVRLDMPVDTLTDRLALIGLNHEGTVEVGGDLAIDLEVTSNRPDCLGHLGVAREVSVLFGNPLRIPDPKPPESGAPVETLTGVSIEALDLCPRFTARVVTGAKIGESPWWLRKRLETLGVRPISNVVDITNYVMFECGQPLHTYDLDTLAEKRLIVRLARTGEKLVAINGKTYELTPEMLVIADALRPVGLAGVMGGLETEIGERTSNILIESALFDPISIRRTSRGLGQSSPSSHRFERPMDPERTDWASRRCAELILELAGGTLHPGVIDVGPPRPQRPSVSLRFAQIPRLLGIDVPQDRSVSILQDLGLELLEARPEAATFRPPSWRSDLGREVDLIEEVARIHGYEHIPEDRPVPLAGSSRGLRERVESLTRDALTGLGFDEAITYSLVDDVLIAPLDPEPVAAPLRAEHSSWKRKNALRQSLAPSLLAALAYNEAHGVADARLFEIAHVYLPRPGKEAIDESTRLGLVAGLDFWGIKGVVEALLERFHLVEELRTRPASPAPSPFVEGRVAELLLGDAHLGYLGEVDRSRLDKDEVPLRSACSAAELAFDVLEFRAELVPRHRPLPAYPAITRDLSLVVDRSIPWAELAEAARGVSGPTLESITFLDTFEGGNLPEDRHSLHFGLTFRHPERTLNGEEADAAIHAIIEACRSRFDASLRT